MGPIYRHYDYAVRYMGINLGQDHLLLNKWPNFELYFFISYVSCKASIYWHRFMPIHMGFWVGLRSI